MGKTPSKRRREGYEAFYPGESPEMVCPYNEKSWNDFKGDWLEGWNKASIQYKEDIKEKEEE